MKQKILLFPFLTLAFACLAWASDAPQAVSSPSQAGAVSAPAGVVEDPAAARVLEENEKRLAAEDARMGYHKAPAFKLKNLMTGKSVSLAGWKGKVVLVDFWATWCPPCRMEIPGFMRLKFKLQKEGLEIIGISMDQNGPEVVRNFARANKITYALAWDPGQIYRNYGGGNSIPTTFLVNKRGRVVKSYVGFTREDEFEKDVRKALAK